MGQWKGQPAWLIHLEQRPDRRPSPIFGFVTDTGDYRAGLKGRAWALASGNQVLHLTVELVKPLEQAQYELVTFRVQRVGLWLPESVDVHVRCRGNSCHQYSQFSQCELFWGPARQKISQPKRAPRKH